MVAVEGQTATNTGTYSDSVISGDVTILASVGEVTKTGTNRGTWSWSLANAALGRLQVTITATDGEGESSTTEFTSTGTLPNGKIAFTSSRDGNEEVYVMNADGTNQTNITNDAAADRVPSWGGVGDTAPPETSVVSGPAALINSNSATFEFSFRNFEVPEKRVFNYQHLSDQPKTESRMLIGER